MKNFLTVFQSFVQRLQEEEETRLFSNSLYHLIMFSELWPRPTPSMLSLQKTFLDSVIGSGIYEKVPMYCIASGGADPHCKELENMVQYPAINESSGRFAFVYDRDRYYDKLITIPTGSSVLLLSGLLDPQTAPKYAQFQFNSFIGPAKKLIEFPYAAHCTVLNTPVTVS